MSGSPPRPETVVDALVRLGDALRTAGLLPAAVPALAGLPGGPLDRAGTAAAVSAEPVLSAPTVRRPLARRPPAPPAEQPVAGTERADGVPEGSEDVAVLVARAQAGSADAFGLLYDRYVDLVYRYVSYRVSSAAVAEDLTSEVFLRALRRIDGFTWQGRDFGAWLVTIARNLVTDHYKSGRSRLEVTTDDVTAGAAHPTTEGPEALVLDILRDRALLEAVQQLPAEQQECVSLRFLQGLSVAETALVMGKGEGAVKAMQYRAVRSLGRLLTREPA